MKSSLRIIYALIVFVLGIVMLSALTVLLIYENRQTQISFAAVTQGNIIKHSLEKILSTLKDGESAHRGFLITGDSLMLKPYYELSTLSSDLDRLDSLVQSDARQKKNASTLRQLLKERQSRMQHILQRNKDESYQRTYVYFTDLQADRNAMLQVRHLVDQMQSHEDINLERKEQDAKRHSVLPAIIGIGISIFSIMIFIVAFYFINAELRKSIALNDELEAKNVQLNKYTHELSSFTHITSHDMQEPLRKIEMFISMIEDREKESLSPHAMEYLDKIKESVARMRQLFFSILSFSLADQVRNVKELVDLNEVLSETLDSLKVYVKDSNAVITTEELPVVFGVRHQLFQLFQNLISNSLKYKRTDVIPEIVINCEVVEGRNTTSPELSKDQLYYKINVTDNGLGFDQKYVDKIFDIFQRHVRTEKNGLGIGLSICRKIAQNHMGTISAESEPGKGSQFSFYIPMSPPTALTQPVTG
jgi:signal transduction histidine kinase